MTCFQPASVVLLVFVATSVHAAADVEFFEREIRPLVVEKCHSREGS